MLTEEKRIRSKTRRLKQLPEHHERNKKHTKKSIRKQRNLIIMPTVIQQKLFQVSMEP